jgi:hypothetical protein
VIGNGEYHFRAVNRIWDIGDGIQSVFLEVTPDFEFEVLHLHLSVSGELGSQTLGAIMLELVVERGALLRGNLGRLVGA